MKIRAVSGELIEASYVRHLRTLAGLHSVDVDLFRTRAGRLVVCTSPTVDGRAIPSIDPDSNPAAYGVRENS